MLDAIGVSELADLFAYIPAELRRKTELDLAPPAGEQRVLRELTALAAQNVHAHSHDWFLGAGTYAHFIPSAVDALVSRAEFATAYTPYQPEISQGTLQAVFEWQTMISGLTGLDVSNASLYDGASATAEAALMAMRITRRSRVVEAATLHPHYHEVLHTYLSGLGGEIVQARRGADGRIAGLEDCTDGDTACLIVQQPNVFGIVEDLGAAAAAAREAGALLVVVVTEALSLALFRPPGALGADIVCGEAQSFGVPMGFGGPHLGFLTTRRKLVRQMPGRLVGETVDARGARGYVLTLSTREQHIRRERATSNICTNQGLCLLMATIYLALHGPKGLRALARDNLARAEYAKTRVRETPGLSLLFDGPTFNEFVVGLKEPAAVVLERAAAHGVVAGLDLAPWAPDLGPALLVCTTELCDRPTIDRWATLVAGSEA